MRKKQSLQSYFTYISKPNKLRAINLILQTKHSWQYWWHIVVAIILLLICVFLFQWNIFRVVQWHLNSQFSFYRQSNVLYSCVYAACFYIMYLWMWVHVCGCGYISICRLIQVSKLRSFFLYNKNYTLWAIFPVHKVFCLWILQNFVIAGSNTISVC